MPNALERAQQLADRHRQRAEAATASSGGDATHRAEVPAVGGRHDLDRDAVDKLVRLLAQRRQP